MKDRPLTDATCLVSGSAGCNHLEPSHVEVGGFGWTDHARAGQGADEELGNDDGDDERKLALARVVAASMWQAIAPEIERLSLAQGGAR